MMITDIDLFVKVVDCRDGDFRPTLEEFSSNGHNFMLIVPPDSETREAICHALRASEEDWLRPVDKTGGVGLILHLRDEDFFHISAALADGAQLCFVEQLMMPGSRGNDFESYMVYCPIRGILSTNQSWEGAKLTWSEHAEITSFVSRYPEPAIFRWLNGKWTMEHRPRESW